MENTPVKFKADVQWAFLDKINEMSERYQVDFCNLSDAAVKALENIGLQPRRREDKPEKGWFIVAKSSIPIKAFDKDGKQIKGIVGNGSKAEVLMKAYHWEWKNKQGISPHLLKFIVTDLVEYNEEEASISDMDDDIL